MSDGSDAGVRSKGIRAKTELAETDIAFDGLRMAMMEEIIKTGPEQLAKRERLIAGVQIIDAVRKALKKAVEAGEQAKTIDQYTQLLAEQNILRA